MRSTLVAPSSENAFNGAVRSLLESLGERLAVADPFSGASASDLQQAARLLERLGHPSRVVRVTPEELTRLPLPTLAITTDGAPMLVLHRHWRRVLVDAPGLGKRFVARSELASRLGGLALERQVRGPETAELGALIRGYLAARKQELVQLVALALLGSLFALAPAWVARTVMDTALPEGGTQWLGSLCAALVFVSLQQAWLGLLRSAVVRRAEALLVRDMLSSVFRKLTEGPFHVLARKPLGTLLQALSSAESAAITTTALVSGPVFDVISATTAALVLLIMQPKLCGALALVVLPTSGATAWLAYRRAQLQAREMVASGAQRASLYETLSGVATIKTLGAERTMIGRWLGLMLDERSLVLARGRLGASRDVLLELSQRSCSWLAFTVAGYGCLSGEVSVGTFLMLTSMADTLARSTRSLCRLADPLLQLRVLARGVDAHLAECAPCEPARGHVRRTDPDAIVLDDVWFRYGPDEPWILQGHSLRVERGQHVHLKGASGAGKTTILRLIAGLYVPERGVVSVFGQDPRRMRDRLAYLPQQAYLFEGSILQNLEILSGAPRERIMRAADRTGLTEWLSALPMGFETILPPGAPNISGGEKQWIVLTAAVAARREVVLLDESLSQVDRLLRQRIRLRDLFRNRTVVHIAHDE